MAIQRQPGFEPQRIARAEPNRLDFGVDEQRFGQRPDGSGGGRDLDTILAGIARTADPQRHPLPVKAARAHEAQLGHAGHQSFHDGHRFGPLQRQQRPVIAIVAGDAGAAQMRDIGGLNRAVDDEIKVLAAPRHHQVIENAAGSIEQQRIAQRAGRQPSDVTRQQRLERLVLRQRHQHLAHMADIEQPGMAAGPQMLSDDAPEFAIILDRHRIAGERHHARAKPAMQRIERQIQDGFGGIGHGWPFRRQCSARGMSPPHLPPPVTGPESFRMRTDYRHPCLPLRWGSCPKALPAFQNVANTPARSFCLRDSGGGLLLRRRPGYPCRTLPR